jgi:hypothetical protein
VPDVVLTIGERAEAVCSILITPMQLVWKIRDQPVHATEQRRWE